MAKQKLLSIKDVATILDVSETTVRNLVRRKELSPPRKVGGRAARWFTSDIEEYLNRLRASPPIENFGRARPRGAAPNRVEPQSD